MLLHLIHTLAKLTLIEIVPPQSRTSPHATVKIYIFNTAISGQAQVAQKS